MTPTMDEIVAHATNTIRNAYQHNVIAMEDIALAVVSAIEPMITAKTLDDFADDLGANSSVTALARLRSDMAWQKQDREFAPEIMRAANDLYSHLTNEHGMEIGADVNNLGSLHDAHCRFHGVRL